MSSIELGFSLVLVSFILLPAVARLSSEIIDWLFSKLKFRRSNQRTGESAKTA